MEVGAGGVHTDQSLENGGYAGQGWPDQDRTLNTGSWLDKRALEKFIVGTVGMTHSQTLAKDCKVWLTREDGLC